MARKSKGKFNMKGHSIPGIKGYKGDSGLYMKSPFLEEDEDKITDDTDAEDIVDAPEDVSKSTLGIGDDHGLTWAEMEKQDYIANRPGAQVTGQSGVDYMTQELIKARNRLRDKKKLEEEPSEVMDDKTQENQPEVKTIKNEPEVEGPDLSQHVVKQPLNVPTPESKPYEVQKGDSLSKIARDNNMSLEELLEKNPEYRENPDFVRTGSTLNL